MKKIITLSLILLFITVEAQEYINLSFDVNKAFHLKDNSRTVSDVYGLDYDVEVGAKDGHFGVYMFYGRFENAGFKNYGAGVDYYVNMFDNIDMSIGVAYSKVHERDFRDKWVGVSWYHIRAVTTIWFHKNIGLSLRIQYQDRNEVAKGYIIEAAAGISIRN